MRCYSGIFYPKTDSIIDDIPGSADTVECKNHCFTTIDNHNEFLQLGCFDEAQPDSHIPYFGEQCLQDLGQTTCICPTHLCNDHILTIKDNSPEGTFLHALVFIVLILAIIISSSVAACLFIKYRKKKNARSVDIETQIKINNNISLAPLHVAPVQQTYPSPQQVPVQQTYPSPQRVQSAPGQLSSQVTEAVIRKSKDPLMSDTSLTSDRLANVTLEKFDETGDRFDVTAATMDVIDTSSYARGKSPRESMDSGHFSLSHQPSNNTAYYNETYDDKVWCEFKKGEGFCCMTADLNQTESGFLAIDFVTPSDIPAFYISAPQEV